MSSAVDRASAALAGALPAALKEHSRSLVLVGGGIVALSTANVLLKSFYKTNPFAFGRTGALDKDTIDSNIKGYESFFNQKDGKGIDGKKKMSTPEFVDKFYRRAAVLRCSDRSRSRQLRALLGGTAAVG